MLVQHLVKGLNPLVDFQPILIDIVKIILLLLCVAKRQDHLQDGQNQHVYQGQVELSVPCSCLGKEHARPSNHSQRGEESEEAESIVGTQAMNVFKFG